MTPREGRGWMRQVLAVVVFCVIGAWVAWPVFYQNATRGQMVTALNNARQMQIATMTMAMDHVAAGREDGGYPADAGDRSGEDFLRRLTEENYLTGEDLERMGIREDFAIVNISAEDPPDTAFLVTRNFGEGEAARPDWLEAGKFFVMTRDGKGAVLREDERALVRLPEREPAV